jgi:hypothetical protein
MKRTKLTDFILKNLQWTGIFLCEQIYLSRLGKTLNDIKNNIDDIETISHKNNDVIKGFSKENFNDRTLYKVELDNIGYDYCRGIN